MVSVNHIKESNVGIDKIIQDVQVPLYDYLVEKWGGSVQGFGRVYRNPKETNVVPEHFIGNGRDYKPVYFDDNYAVNFFFVDDQTHESEDGIVFNAKVKIAFMMNLEKAKPLGNMRMDEECHVDVYRFLNNLEDGRVKVTGIQKGIDAVFLGFNKSRIELNDMHPKHTFSVRTTLYYYLNECYN